MPAVPNPVLDRPSTEQVGESRNPDVSAGGMTGSAVPRHRVRRVLRRRWKALLAAVVIVSVPVGCSYLTYLTEPGTASAGERSVDWLRDHGADGVVNRVEQWWYTRTPPGDGVPAASMLPAIPAPVPARGATASAVSAMSGMAATDVAAVPADLDALSPDPMVGEGVWTPGVQSVIGRPVLYTTFLRPDPANTSVVAGIVEFDQHLVRTVAVPGTNEPGGSGWAWNSHIPVAERATLVAAFNSGFKFRHIDGGYYAESRMAQPLVDGDASLVIDDHGTIDIGAWGRDVAMTPHVASVRQNLHLIVDHGRVVGDLQRDRTGKYGTPRHQLQFTWRSAIGITGDGNIVFVAGNKMTMSALANALADAGAVRGMQLDIHTGQVTATLFAPIDTTTTGVTGTRLLPNMPKPVTRYLKTDQRDFFAVFVR